jgi:hypothetical protein
MNAESPEGPRVEQPTAAAAEALSHTVERRTWQEFQSTGLLWAANTILHWFGWAIVIEVDADTGEVRGAYPVRTKWRGFPAENNERGIQRLTEWMATAGTSLREDIKEPEPDEPV